MYGFWGIKLNHKGQTVGKTEDKDTPFTVDTIPVLNFKPKRQLSTDRVLVQRVVGEKKEQSLSQPASLWIGGQGCVEDL